VLPRSHKEDKQFRKQLLEKPDLVRWDDVYTVTKKGIAAEFRWIGAFFILAVA
jgi:hypothetical protein